MLLKRFLTFLFRILCSSVLTTIAHLEYFIQASLRFVKTSSIALTQESITRSKNQTTGGLKTFIYLHSDS